MPELWRKCYPLIEFLDLFGHFVDQESLLGAVIPVVVLGGADKVGINISRGRFGIVNDQSGSAFTAVDCALQVMLVGALTLAVDMAPENFLNLVPGRFINGRIMFPRIPHTVVGDHSFVIRIIEDVVQEFFVDRFGW
ncbi:MAG: hypothetical protein FWC55_05235 [Firmicutes bacterium]|nr:hypothetical protein [Bacillota bacterium]